MYEGNSQWKTLQVKKNSKKNLLNKKLDLKKHGETHS